MIKIDTLHVFFHRDFDGICSAAVFLAYARKSFLLPQCHLEFIPVDYDLKKEWATMTLPKPCVIVDFLYHPDADWWFDHHQTTFVRQDWEFSFRSDERHAWNTSYESCPRLVIDSIPPQSLREELRSFFSDYLNWCDIIDSAQYESARQVIECKGPALQINLSLAIDRSSEYLERLIRLFGENTLADVASSPDVQSRFLKGMKWQKESLSFLEKVADVEDQVVFCDLTAKKGIFNRYAAYYLWPEATFLVAVYSNGKGFRLTISSNPWVHFVGPDLSALAEKFGGGGHPRVAGISASSRKRALQIGHEIAQILRGKSTFVHQLSLRDQLIRQSH